MIKALGIAATGMEAQESNVSNIANNISNVNTNGFKRGRTEFEDLLYETVQEPGAKSSNTTNYNIGIQYGSGAKVSAVNKIYEMGNPDITNNPFDFMISGDGFFGIIMPNNQVKYTRDGSFNLDAQGNLVTKKGHRVFPGLTVPPNTTNVNVSENGIVEAYQSGQVQPQNIGSIPVFTFVNPPGLKSAGGNLMDQTVASGAPIQNVPGENNAGSILQGTLETSNVKIMNEMTNLIKAQRAYEMNSKIMGVADQMLQTVNNVK